MRCCHCDENIKDRGANRKKVNGVWMHKVCPADAGKNRARKKEKRNARKDIANN